jgi:hypothetical protein
MVVVDFGVASNQSTRTDPFVYIFADRSTQNCTILFRTLHMLHLLFPHTKTTRNACFSITIVPTDQSRMCLCVIIETENRSHADKNHSCKKGYLVDKRHTPMPTPLTSGNPRGSAHTITLHRARFGLAFWSSSSGVSLSLRRLYSAVSPRAKANCICTRNCS